MSHVMTVLGPIPPSQLGFTTCHEHLLIDLTPWLDPPSGDATETAPIGLDNLGWQHRDPFFRGIDNNRLDEIEVAIDELSRFREAGGSTLVDLTANGLKPRPEDIARIAQASGVNVILGVGEYRVVGHDPWLLAAPVEAIADRLLAQIDGGVGGTSIHPGIIGEIGTSDVIHPSEARVLQAAAQVQSQTGLAVNVHCDPWAGRVFDVLDIVEQNGGDLGRTVMSHLDHSPIDLGQLVRIAGRGAIVEFDGFGCEWYLDSRRTWLPRDIDRIQAIARLFDAGFGGQIVIGSDTCRKVQLIKYGGWGYEHIPRNVVGMFGWFGLTDSEVRRITHETPLRLLTVDHA